MSKLYRGGCQCGAVSYEVEVDLDSTITCKCSRCQPMGFVLAFSPRDNVDYLFPYSQSMNC